MKIEIESAPFNTIRAELRVWFSNIVSRAKTGSSFDVLRVPLPKGSSQDDVISVTAAICHLFPFWIGKARTQKTLSLMALPPFEVWVI